MVATEAGADISNSDIVRSTPLASRRDDHGSRHLDVQLRADGSLVIAGQDLHRAPPTGHPLEEVYGAGTSEYEYATSVAPDDVPALLDLLGLPADGDPLEELRTLSTNDAFELTTRVREAGLDQDRWSRAG